MQVLLFVQTIEKDNTMSISREQLLQEIESVRPGLSPKEIVEQSNCFVFRNGEVQSYNDEIACRHKCCLKVTGAVEAGPFLEILSKLHDDALTPIVKDGELRLSGKRGKTGLRLEQEILLGIENIEQPKKWTKLPAEFADAVMLTHSCASQDESQPSLGCIHIHPEWIEACDNLQIARYRMATGIKDPILVRSNSLKHIVGMDMTEWSRTETWLHFRNGSGLILSCRRYMEEYDDLDPLLKVKGTPTTLPKGLVEAAQRCNVFSSQNDRDEVLVEMRPGKLRIKGQGVNGWYSEVKQLKYSGKPLAFLIEPKLLIELVTRYNDCEVTADRLKVDGGKYLYITCLGDPNDVGSAASENGETAEASGSGDESE